MEILTSRKTVLVAVRPSGFQTICDALKPEFNMAVVHTLEAARSRLNSDDISAIVCGVHFDSSRMLDFLTYAKSNPRTKKIPFYVVLGSDYAYSEAIVDAIRIATGVLGAEGFVDLSMFADTEDEEQAYENFRFSMRKPRRGESSSRRAM
jgi:hypothetical protein